MPYVERQPLVSILTPAYQQLGYIRRCIESVLAQSYARWELVVADDGSTDGTPEAVEAYRDARIQVLRLPHRGLGALAETYNAALARTSGPLVAILEGDDRWPPDKLALQVPVFEDEGVALSWGVNAAHIAVPESVQMFLMQQHVTMSVLGRTVVRDALFIAAVTTIASIVPAIHAARLRPVTAMHHIG